MTTDEGGPAFPVLTNTEGFALGLTGMSLRDYFAANAMQSLLYETIKIEGDATTHRVARDAYRIADAMLEGRKK